MPQLEQVPALVQPHLDRLEPVLLGRAQATLGAALVELVLFRDELPDVAVDLLGLRREPPDVS